MLKEIKSNDLIFSNEIEDDRTNTFLTLNDYDWMEYILKTRFRTEEQGILEVEFKYFGMVFSTMKVTQSFNGETKIYDYSFPTEVFQKYLVLYMTNHIKAWESTYAFNGEEEVIAFFNEVLKVGTITDGKHINPKDYENKQIPNK